MVIQWLQQKFKEMGYDIEKLPPFEEDDPLYMALTNKRRTGKFERQRQRELIQLWKPWTKSTGAKTLEGKKRSVQNAYKNGKSLENREMIRQLNKFLKKQKDLIMSCP